MGVGEELTRQQAQKVTRRPGGWEGRESLPQENDLDNNLHEFEDTKKRFTQQG